MSDSSGGVQRRSWEPEPTPREVKASAGALVLGVLLLAVGAVVFSFGQQAYLYDQLTSTGWRNDPPVTGIVIGVLVTLAGLVTTVVAAYRLAVNVDYSARVAAALAFREQLKVEGDPEPREPDFPALD